MASCTCDCGRVKDIRVTSLIRGYTKSCGCIRIEHCALRATPANAERAKKDAKDHIGERFGRLVIVDTSYDASGNLYHCLCDCGNNTDIRKYHSMVRGDTRSCGCYHREQASKSGAAHINNSERGIQCYFQKGKKRIRLRSLYELMFAEILTAKKVRWSYEPKWFKLRPDLRYLPDFKVGDMYYEVKGKMTDKCQEKIDEFRKQGHQLTVITKDDLEAMHPLSYEEFYNNYRLANPATRKTAKR